MWMSDENDVDALVPDPRRPAANLGSMRGASDTAPHTYAHPHPQTDTHVHAHARAYSYPYFHPYLYPYSYLYSYSHPYPHAFSHAYTCSGRFRHLCAQPNGGHQPDRHRGLRWGPWRL